MNSTQIRRGKAWDKASLPLVVNEQYTNTEGEGLGQAFTASSRK